MTDSSDKVDLDTSWHEGWDGPKDEGVPYDPNNMAHQRMFGERVSVLPEHITDADPVAHSDEAIKILLEQGTDAYQRYLAGK